MTQLPGHRCTVSVPVMRKEQRQVDPVCGTAGSGSHGQTEEPSKESRRDEILEAAEARFRR